MWYRGSWVRWCSGMARAAGYCWFSIHNVVGNARLGRSFYLDYMTIHFQASICCCCTFRLFPSPPPTILFTTETLYNRPWHVSQICERGVRTPPLKITQPTFLQLQILLFWHVCPVFMYTVKSVALLRTSGCPLLARHSDLYIFVTKTHRTGELIHAHQN